MEPPAFEDEGWALDTILATGLGLYGGCEGLLVGAGRGLSRLEERVEGRGPA